MNNLLNFKFVSTTLISDRGKVFGWQLFCQFSHSWHLSGIVRGKAHQKASRERHKKAKSSCSSLQDTTSSWQQDPWPPLCLWPRPPRQTAGTRSCGGSSGSPPPPPAAAGWRGWCCGGPAPPPRRPPSWSCGSAGRASRLFLRANASCSLCHSFRLVQVASAKTWRYIKMLNKQSQHLESGNLYS